MCFILLNCKVDVQHTWTWTHVLKNEANIQCNFSNITVSVEYKTHRQDAAAGEEEVL